MNFLILLPLIVIPYYFTHQYLEEAAYLFVLSSIFIFIKRYIHHQRIEPLPLFLILFPITLLGFQSEFTQSRDLFLVCTFAWGALFAWSQFQFNDIRFFLLFVLAVACIGFLDLLHITHYWNQTYIYHEFVLKSIFSQKNEFAFFNTLWLTWYIFHRNIIPTKYKYLGLALFTTASFMLLFSNAKSGIIAFAFVLGLVSLNRYTLKIRLTLIVFVSISILSIAYLRWNVIEVAFAERLFIAKASYSMMVDFFPSGAGIGSYPFWIKAYFEPGTDAGHLFHKVVSSPHNFILDFLIDFGLWGGLLLGFGFWSIARGLSNEVLKPRRMEFLSYWALIFIQGLLIQPISFQPLAIFFIGYLYYKSTEFLWTLHSARFKWMAYVQILSLLPLVYFTFNYGLHLYRTKDLLNLYETLNEKNYVDMPKLIELQKSGFKDPRMDRLFLTNAQISKNIKNVHAEARVLLEKTNYLYPLEFSLASTYAANGQWAECVETIDVDLQKFGRNNYTSLNLKAECLFKLNCEDFLKWKQTMQGYFGISLDYKYPIWYQRSCNTP